MDIVKRNVIYVLYDYLEIVDERLRHKSDFNFLGNFFLTDGIHWKIKFLVL